MAGFPWGRLGIRLNIVAVNLLKESQLMWESIKRPNPGQLACSINRLSQCQELRHSERYPKCKSNFISLSTVIPQFWLSWRYVHTQKVCEYKPPFWFCSMNVIILRTKEWPTNEAHGNGMKAIELPSTPYCVRNIRLSWQQRLYLTFWRPLTDFERSLSQRWRGQSL